MKYVFCASLLSIVIFSSCCSIRNCDLGQTRVVPYFNGKYILPSLPIDQYYILVNRKKVNDMPYVANGGLENIDCGSDVPTTLLKCCEKYSFHLFVSFLGGATGPMILDSTSVKIKPKNGCMILDVDPHHD